MKRTFHYEYEHGDGTTIRFDYADADDAQFETWVTEDGSPAISCNASGALILARTLIQFAQRDLAEGFHVHLRKDFDADQPEVLMISRSGSSRATPPG